MTPPTAFDLEMEASLSLSRPFTDKERLDNKKIMATWMVNQWRLSRERLKKTNRRYSLKLQKGQNNEKIVSAILSSIHT